jgi:hypothetical protein
MIFFLQYFLLCELKIFFGGTFLFKSLCFEKILKCNTNNLILKNIALSFYRNIAYENRSSDKGLRLNELGAGLDPEEKKTHSGTE